MHHDRHRLAYLIDRLVASDPALERLRGSLRGVLTAGIAAGLFLLLTRRLGLKFELSLGGIVVPMIAAVALPDAGRRQQQVTMAWVPVVASAMLVLGSLVGGNPWLSGGCFLLIIFVAFEVRRFGPRAGGLGTIAYQSFFYALLLKVPASKAYWDPLFVFAGCAIAFGIRFWLVPEHPGRMLRNELRAWRARIAALLHDLARRLDDGGKAGGEAAGKRVDAHLAALNGQSLGLESRLAGFARDPDGADTAALRAEVLHGELAAEAVAAAVRAAGGSGDRERRRLAAGLRALAEEVGHGRAIDSAAWSARYAPAAGVLPEALRWRLRRALDTLARLPSLRQPSPAMRDERQPLPIPASAGAGNRAWWDDDTTRRALQACAAALAALLAGRALSPDHWFWAVFASFVVFARTATVGQTLSGAWRQILATVAGVCVGIAAAELVHGHRGIELSLLFVFIAAGFYAFHGMQNAYTVLLSAMLAMLYELMGMNSPGLLLLRLEETAIGALSAVLSARLVLPAHTRDESGSKSAGLLRAAAGLLRAVWTNRQAAAQHAAMRELDRAVQALRQALGPVTGTDYPGSKQNRRQHLARLARLAYCVRHGCALAMHHAPRLAQSDPLREAAGVLASRLDGTAGLLASPERRTQPQEALPALVLPEEKRADADAIPFQLAARWLVETDQALRAVRAELQAPGKP
ncbi:FUSC family protein [Massilia sp. LXY-6]|uniref:FUSC family protein n=1 Tax=Massilia sp. LXY-6 TaxID=3379823 RepID=UPI003EE06ED6